jgi:hypothetical protein
MDLQQLARQIPDYPVFLSIDEMTASSHALAAEFPALVSLRTVGHTRRGDPIELITIRGGEKQAFVFGGPHPNEPIGCMTIEFLTRRLCEDDALRDELGYTWHFIKSIDSDGMRLNEGWFKGPFTPTQYARHFFRPAPFDQVEWTFPLDYKTLHFNSPLPETEALMRVIDEIRPTLLYSLHNAGFGGVYYYCSGGDDQLFRAFHEIPGWFGLPLELGEPEVSYLKPYAPAIYGMISARDSYDHLEQNGIADPAAVMQSGASSAEYSEKYGSYFLVVEMPYFDDPRVNDQSPTTTRRRDAILASLDGQDEFDRWIDENLAEARALLQRETPITRAVNAFLSMGREYRQAERQWAQTAPETDRPASQAEVFSNMLGSRFYRLLILGMMARIMDDEIAAGNAAPQLAATRNAALERLAAQGAALEAELNYRALPIRSLVGVQVCAGLAAAEYLRDRRA